MESLWQDVYYAARTLRRSPGFTITFVLVLALAITANTGMFSVIEGVLLRPLPYHDPQQLFVLWKTVPTRSIETDWTSYPTIRDWRERTSLFEDLAVILRPEASQVKLMTDAGTVNIQGSKVSGNFFDLMGVAPFRGRTFSSDESQRGDRVVLLSYGFWQMQFGGSDAVLGQTVKFDGTDATIIGVMPPTFEFPDKNTQLWMLLTSDVRWTAFQQVRIADAFAAVARLKRGISIEQAKAEMEAISAVLAREYPTTDAGLDIRIVPLFDQIASPQLSRMLWLIGGAALFLLLVACSNIAGLLIARGTSRKRELAVRAALGATRGRLLRQLVTENVLLSLSGGVVGVLLTYWGLQAVLAVVPMDLPRSEGINVNLTVLAFTFCVCLLTGIIFGLVPASKIVGAHSDAALYQGSRGASSGRGVNRMQGVFVALQFGLAIVLLTGAGLLIRSFLLLNAMPIGFDMRNVLTMTLDLSSGRYQDRARREAFLEDATARINALPGVLGAAVGSGVLDSFRDHVPNQKILVEGRLVTEDVIAHGRDIVSAGYFQLLGIRLLEGRIFSPSDTSNGPGAAVINESMARRFWPSESAIGKRFTQVLPGTEAPWLTVAGVVADVLYNRDGTVVPIFYRPLQQWSLPIMSLVVRTETDPSAIAASIRSAVRSGDPTIPYFEVTTVQSRLAELDRPRSFQTQLLSAFAAVGLALAALGLYGAMTYSITQRTREIGIRLALGASRGNIIYVIVGEGLAWAVLGLTVGLIGALAFGRALSGSLFGIRPTDPTTIITIIGVLALVAVAAAVIPTRRATTIDPAAALNSE